MALMWSLDLVIFPSKYGRLKNLFLLLIYVRKIAGFNLLMAHALAGWLLGTEIPSIFLCIL